MLKYRFTWAGSSVVERCPDKTEVHGPIPCPPTVFWPDGEEETRESAKLLCEGSIPSQASINLSLDQKQ